MVTEDTVTIDGTTITIQFEETGLLTAMDRCPYCESTAVSSIDRASFQCEDCTEVCHPLREPDSRA